MDVMMSRGRPTGRRSAPLMWALLGSILGMWLFMKAHERHERKRAEERERSGLYQPFQ